jgi:TrwC relaxase
LVSRWRAYYLEKVASGIEDYYLHAGEAPGVWLSAEAARLGLAGEVVAHDGNVSRFRATMGSRQFEIKESRTRVLGAQNGQRTSGDT